MQDFVENSAAFEAVGVAEVDDLPRRPVHGSLLPHVRVAGGRVVLGVPHGGEDKVSTGVVRGLLPGTGNTLIQLFLLKSKSLPVCLPPRGEYSYEIYEIIS